MPTPGIRAGTLRHQVTLEQPAEPQDRGGSGEPGDLWQTVAVLAAWVQPLSGDRLVAAQALAAEATYKVSLRWRPGVTPRMRLLWREKTLNVLWASNPDGLRVALELLCAEEVVT